MIDRKVIFSLLFSHHPPCQNNRTFLLSFGSRKLRICARCTGELFGLIATLITLRYFSTCPLWLSIAIATVLPLGAIIDWSTQANGTRESTNGLRFITGAMFSSACVFIGHFIALQQYWVFALTIGVDILEGIIAVKLLQRAGAIELVLIPFEKYAESILKT